MATPADIEALQTAAASVPTVSVPSGSLGKLDGPTGDAVIGALSVILMQDKDGNAQSKARTLISQLTGADGAPALDKIGAQATALTAFLNERAKVNGWGDIYIDVPPAKKKPEPKPKESSGGGVVLLALLVIVALVASDKR